MRNTGSTRDAGALTDYLEDQRQLRGWAKARLAREIGVDRTTLFRWLNGDIRAVQPQHIRRIATALDADYDELLAMAGIRPDEPDAEPQLDADTERAMATLLRRLRDPRTSPAQKAIIKGALTELAALPESAPSEQSGAETA